MITSDSRYQDAERAFATAHIYDEHGRILLNNDDGVAQVRTATHEATYRLSVPDGAAPPPLEYHVVQGESMQYIAWKTMRQAMSWWLIAESNQSVWYPLDIPLGTALKIPL